MANTFSELVLECRNYGYSKEGYEFAKECYELDLMTKFLESQAFLSESMDTISKEYPSFNSGYFIEASSESDAKDVDETHKQKSDNVFRKFLNGIKKLWNNFKNFFKRLFDENEKINREIKTIIEDLDGIIDKDFSLSGEDVEELKEIIDDCWYKKYIEEGFDITFNRTSVVADVIDRICEDIKDKELANKVRAAFTLDRVVIKLSTNRSKKKTYAANDERIYNLYRIFFDAVAPSKKTLEDGTEIEIIDVYSIYRACKKLDDAIEKIRDDRTFSIDVSGHKLKSAINNLSWQDYYKMKYDLSGDRYKIVYSDINKIYEAMNEILANTIALYGYVARYRTVTPRTFKKFINKVLSNKKDD